MDHLAKTVAVDVAALVIAVDAVHLAGLVMTAAMASTTTGLAATGPSVTATRTAALATAQCATATSGQLGAASVTGAVMRIATLGLGVQPLLMTRASGSVRLHLRHVNANLPNVSAGSLNVKLLPSRRKSAATVIQGARHAMTTAAMAAKTRAAAGPIRDAATKTVRVQADLAAGMVSGLVDAMAVDLPLVTVDVQEHAMAVPAHTALAVQASNARGSLAPMRRATRGTLVALGRIVKAATRAAAVTSVGSVITEVVAMIAAAVTIAGRRAMVKVSAPLTLLQAETSHAIRRARQETRHLLPRSLLTRALARLVPRSHLVRVAAPRAAKASLRATELPSG